MKHRLTLLGFGAAAALAAAGFALNSADLLISAGLAATLPLLSGHLRPALPRRSRRIDRLERQLLATADELDTVTRQLRTLREERDFDRALLSQEDQPAPSSGTTR